MPTLLFHLTSVERLARCAGLAPDFRRALTEDLAYARFGTALPDLPMCDGVLGAVSGVLRPRRALPHWSLRFHEGAPVALGLKMAELVASGALVGTEPGLALVAGYFTHLSLDRALHRWVDLLVERHRRPGERELEVHHRIEWAQTLFFLRETRGSELLGTPAVRPHFQVVKRAGPPLKGVGGGIYELVRVASLHALQEAPTKAEVDGWVRGLYMAGVVLSTPLGRTRGLPPFTELSFRELYRTPGPLGDAGPLDFGAEVEAALARTCHVLDGLLTYMTRGIFTPRTRARFLEDFPEGSVGVRAA